MEIWHHVIFTEDSTVRIISDLGIEHQGSPPHGIGVFDISESHQAWTEVSRLIEEKDLTQLVYTTFTDEEVLSAEWLRVNVTFEQGYPQPEATWDETTLDKARGCGKCHIGHIQKDHFQIRKEPHLGKKDFMSLNWTAVVLASSRVFEALASSGARGYSKRAVLIRSTRQPAEKVAQIYVARETQPGLLETSALRTENLQAVSAAQNSIG